MATTITPGPRTAGAKKGFGRKNDNNKIYAYPLPLVLEVPEPQTRWSPNFIGLFGLSTSRVLNPHCEGVFDDKTKSVWVLNSKDSMILWQRGFFGKGNLSRSEPSWFARQVNQRQTGTRRTYFNPYLIPTVTESTSVVSTAEEVTARRRAERKQFKLDRARALAAAAQEAEAAFAAGRTASPAPSIAIPSAATWKPARVDTVEPVPKSTAGDEQDEEEPELENLEHLQLTLPEAFFLLWSIDCLTILDPITVSPAILHEAFPK